MDQHPPYATELPTSPTAIPVWQDAARRRDGKRPIWRRAWKLLAAVGLAAIAGSLWLAGFPAAATACAATATLFLTLLVGLTTLRWLLSGSHGVSGVARAVIDEAAGTRLPFLLVMLLVLGLPLLPIVLDPTERLEYRMQFLLDWSLSGAGFLLAMIAILLACSSVCSDISTQRIHMTLSKPLARWQYLLGKWIGIVLLEGLLVILTGIGTYAAVTMLRQSNATDAADRLAVNEQVLTARSVARPAHPRRGEFEAAVATAVEQLQKDDPGLFAKDPKGARNRFYSYEVMRWHTVSASKVSAFDFTLRPPGQLGAELVQLRIKPFSDNASMDRADVKFVLWLNERPFPIRDGIHEEFTFASGSFHTIDLPASSIDDEGHLRVTIANRNLVPPGDTEPTSLSFVPGKGMELLYRVDSFAANFLRGLLVMWSKLAMLTAAALAAASWLGFPIAVMASLLIYASAVGRAFLADAVDIYTGLDNATPTLVSMMQLRTMMLTERLGKLEFWEAAKTVTSFVADGFLALVPSFGRYNAVTEVATGRLCSTAEALWSVGELGILYPAVAILIGWALLERRDLVNLSES